VERLAHHALRGQVWDKSLEVILKLVDK
jgi:hypothetical protein